jgi:hypothetical protein
MVARESFFATSLSSGAASSGYSRRNIIEQVGLTTMTFAPFSKCVTVFMKLTT